MYYNGKSVYQQKFDDDMGIFFTEEEFPELKDAADDVSDVLKKALRRLVEEQHYGILYIPEGEYRIKKTIPIPRAVRLIGYGEKRPVFILPESTEGFTGYGEDEPVKLAAGYSENCPDANYMFWFVGNTDVDAEKLNDANAGTFYSALSNIDFRVEKHNTGAICIRAHFAQHCFVSHCHFDLGDGLAAIYDVGNEMEDLTFRGGKYGIITKMCSPGWPFALLDCEFDGQREAAVLSTTTGFTAFRLNIKNTKKAFDIYIPEAWEKLYLQDCIFQNISEVAITSWASDNIKQQTNIQSLRCSNVPVLLKRADTGEVVAGREGCYLVKEYSRGYMAGDTKEASTQEILECEAIEEIGEVSQGDIPALAPMEKWVSVKKYGAVGDGETDDTEAIQKAVQAEKILYFPQGVYRVTDTICLPQGVSLYGFHPFSTQLALLQDTPNFSGFGTPKPILETAEGGFACINGIGIETSGKNPRAVGVKWMADGTSYMNDVKFVGGHGNMRRDGKNAFEYLYNPGKTGDYYPDRVWDYQYSSLWITNNGGGIFKDVWSASPYSEAGIAITNTTTKGRMYAISLEHHVRCEIKMYKVENWEFYALQTEEEKGEGLKCLPMELVDCKHIKIANYFLFRVVAVDRDYEAGIRIWNSSDLLFLNLENKAQMQFTFRLTLEDKNTGFHAKAAEYARLYIAGENKKTATDAQVAGADTAYAVLAEGFDFAQGVTFDREKNLYWCDKAEKRIYKYDREKDCVVPFLDIHFMPAALAVDSGNNLLVAADYAELRNSNPGNSIDDSVVKYHPFFSWFYKRGEKAYAVSLADPYNTMQELVKVSADTVNPSVVYRPAELDYENFAQQATARIEEYYMAPDGITAMQGTIDLGRCVQLAAAVEGKTFLLSNDAGHHICVYEVTKGGNLRNGKKVTNRGFYGAVQDKDGLIWTVEDRLYAFKDGVVVRAQDVPGDAHSIVSDGEQCYIIGRNKIYRCGLKLN